MKKIQSLLSASNFTSQSIQSLVTYRHTFRCVPYFIAGMLLATLIITNYYNLIIQKKFLNDDEEGNSNNENSLIFDWEKKDFYDHLKFLNQEYSDDQHGEFIGQFEISDQGHFIPTVQKQKNTPKLTPKDRCISMLNDGHWADDNVDHILCSKDDNCKANVWKPKSCHWHAYTTQETRTCLKNEKILILGDSRGRQGYIGLKNRLTGDRTLYDEVEHHDLRFDLYGTSLEWYWTTSINDNKLADRLYKILESDIHEWPDLRIA